MSTQVYLITPPFTQLNTPYPATAYLKGFLNTKGISSFQADLGIEVTLALFTRERLAEIFATVTDRTALSANAARIYDLRDAYIRCVDDAVLFLQGSDPTLAHRIVSRNFLPEAGRFEQANDSDWAFGPMGKQDKAKYLATMFLEDIGDFIRETIDPHFGFSRYAEKLGRSAASFDAIYEELQLPPGFIDRLLFACLEKQMKTLNPLILAVSVPFPGNLYSAFRCAQWVKEHYPLVKTVMGGGFANTELRSLNEPRVFEFFDFITLDDGEAPLENLVGFCEGKKDIADLKRTFLLEEGRVVYRNNSASRDYKQAEAGTPDYRDLLLNKYISAIEVVNPMHSLWSDGRWNKLTMAHGCYWGKCTFCDISLDYIKLYEPLAAAQLCDRMELIMEQTGQSGFHFVDEAAPPAMMRALALEIIRRKMVVSWWTNIRFEKSFTRDLCRLLQASGCIAVSGGLEVASDRLLDLIQKGITVAQVARVNRHFTDAGIMVHAYLMYGFPTQTAQETIDSLEMVRQMFGAGILQSAFWHQFTMTVHSPVGMDPGKFRVKKQLAVAGSFSNNDLEHEDPSGADHPKFAYGLKKSLHNYMHGRCLADPLQKWFDFKTPRTTVVADYISRALMEDALPVYKPAMRVVWIGETVETEFFTQSKQGQQREMVTIQIAGLRERHKLQLPAAQGKWLADLLPAITPNQPPVTLADIRQRYEKEGWDDFELFWYNKPMTGFYRYGLLQL